MATTPDPAAPDPMVPRLARVKARQQELADTVTLEIEVDHWRGFRPGQFNMLGLFGVGEVPISISGDPGSGGPVIHTIRDVGAVSHALSVLEPGAMLTLRGPFGTPWPVGAAKGRDVVVVAGGLGLAPVRPIIHELLANRQDYGRIFLFYGARSPGDILFQQELSAWKSRLDLTVGVTVDHARDGWHGHVGVVTQLLRTAGFDAENCAAFVCGPEIMMRFAANALTDRGVCAESIQLSMERNMQCAVGLCGHCQLGPHFVCKDGPVFTWQSLRPLMAVKEL